jgi:hypothetical protein
MLLCERMSSYNMNSSGSRGKSLEDRMNELTQKLNKMDADLDKEVADDIESSTYILNSICIWNASIF